MIMNKKRISKYLEAMDKDQLDEYYSEKIGLHSCPICRSTKHFYIVKNKDDEIIHARCYRCKEFYYNPTDIEQPMYYNGKFKQDHKYVNSCRCMII